MSLDIGTLSKRIEKSTSWREVREIFNKVKKGWRDDYRILFTDFIDSLDMSVLTLEDRDLVDDLSEEIRTQKEVLKPIKKKNKVLNFKPSDSVSIIIKDGHKSDVIYEAERMAICETLEQNKYNRHKTAMALGISVRSLLNKLDKYIRNKDITER